MLSGIKNSYLKQKSPFEFFFTFVMQSKHGSTSIWRMTMSGLYKIWYTVICVIRKFDV